MDNDESLLEYFEQLFLRSWQNIKRPFAGNKKGYKKGYRDGFFEACHCQQKKIDKLVEALKFYAEYNANADGEGIYEKTYTNSSMFKVTEPDCGSTARQTLKELRLE